MVWPSEFLENRKLVNTIFYSGILNKLSVCLTINLEYVRINLQFICNCRFLNIRCTQHFWASQVVKVVKDPPASAVDVRRGFDPYVRKIPWFGKIPWKRAQQPTPVLLPGESHGQRSLGNTVHEVAKSRTRLRGLKRMGHRFLKTVCAGSTWLWDAGLSRKL